MKKRILYLITICVLTGIIGCGAEESQQIKDNVVSEPQSNVEETAAPENEELNIVYKESQEVETDTSTPEGIYDNESENIPDSVKCAMNYASSVLSGNVEDMLAAIAKEEYEIVKQNRPDAIDNFREYYLNIYEQEKINGEGCIPMANFETCYVYGWENFLDFAGATEEDISLDYVKIYDKYHIYSGVCYAWYNMETDDLNYRSFQPSDSIIIGEKNGKFEIIMALTEFCQ